MKKPLLLTAVSLSLATTVHAIVIPLESGFEIGYSANLGRGTLHGSDITDIAILETDGTQVSLDFGFTAPNQGPFTLTHEIPFDPTGALILGIDLAPLDSGLKDHLVVFMDRDFAADALTMDKFSTVFPAIDGRPRVGHNALMQAVRDARGGDSDATTIVTEFFTTDAGKFATFDPNDSFKVIEFSGPVDILDSGGTLLLLSASSIGMMSIRRRLRGRS